jgi:DNA/RNA-binding domain of Phe-tRNA-synthetase-like protein
MPGGELLLPPFAVEGELAALVDIGLLTAGNLAVTPAGAAIGEAIAVECAAKRAFAGGRAIGDVPGVAPVRRLMSALGTDPTKTRPSSEALLRRVLKGQRLHAVNNVVDTINLASLRWLLPMGLYDLAAVRGALRLARGSRGDGYAGIGKDHVNLADRPALYDDAGPFGAPTSDSFRTRVHEGTMRILLVVFAPRDIDPEILPRCVADTRELLATLCGAQPGEERLLRGPGAA